MTFKQAAFLSLAGLAAIVAVHTLIFGLMSLGESTPHPTDQYLEQTFRAYETDFNKLSICATLTHMWSALLLTLRGWITTQRGRGLKRNLDSQNSVGTNIGLCLPNLD
jgi:hypothetical protein